MPPSGAGAIGAAGAAKKKKKGRPPAHQNVFAFRHNPKSTKTATILATPIRHCCRRCHDKLVWRKSYRKYKPLTQASTCNICRQRNITAAYHTICTKCTQSSSTAVALLQTWNNERNSATLIVDEEEYHSSDDDGDDDCDDDDGENATFEDDNHVDAGKEPVHEGDFAEVRASATTTAPETEAVEHNNVHSYTRVCAMCVKQPALPDEEDEASSDWDNTVVNPDGTRRPLKLRELKSIRRQREKTLVKKPKKVAADENENNYEDDENENDDSEEKDDSDDEGNDEPERLACVTDMADDDEDPFLKAVGGPRNLLTGEAFQQMLLKTGKLNLTTGMAQQLSQQSIE